MKIFIETDLEGATGVFRWEQAGSDGNTPEYERARHLLTADVNAAVAGALAGGASEVLVGDGHGRPCNFVIEKLHPGARYIIGGPRLSSTRYLDSGFVACMLVGAHAMAGASPAVLDHTQDSAGWHNFFVNGVRMGEIGQEAVWASHYGLPLIFVSGDRAACEEARALLGDIETVEVKQALSRTCAIIMPPEKTGPMITEGVARAVRRVGEFKPYPLEKPIEVKLETQNTDLADGYARAGWKRVGDRVLTRTVESALDIL